MTAALEAIRLDSPRLDERSKYLRRLVVRCLEMGERGHIGSSMSLIEIMREMPHQMPPVAFR